MPFRNPRKADRELTQHMISDISADLSENPDAFTVVVAGSLFATANAQGLADNGADPDAYPPPGHSFSRRR